jgi:hypothetical protein
MMMMKMTMARVQAETVAAAEEMWIDTSCSNQQTNFAASTTLQTASVVTMA